MSLLLDTSALLMLACNDPRVPLRARETVRTYPGDVYASVVSLWEIGLKSSLGKLDLPTNAERFFITCVKEMELRALDLDLRAAARSETLPLLHRDPFDRMLVAQALSLGAVMVTNDTEIARYPVRTAWS